MNLKANLKWSEVQSVIMLIGLPLGTAEQIYNNALTKSERELEINKVINKEIKEYEGLIPYEKVIEAVHVGMSLVVVGPFMKEKERKKFLRTIRDIECTKIALVDAVPYEMCCPNGLNVVAEFEETKRDMSFPLISEGFDEIKINSIPHSSLPRYYCSKSYIKRTSKELAHDLFKNSHIAAKTILQIQYLRNKCDVFQEALTLLGAFYLNSGKESCAKINIKKLDSLDLFDFPYFQNISALNFYTYASEYLELLNSARYNNLDIYNMALAIQLHSDDRIKAIIADDEKSAMTRKKLGELYSDIVIDAAVLLRQSVIYAEKYLDDYIESCDGDEFMNDAIYKRMIDAWEYVLGVLKTEAAAVSRKGKISFKI